ncbi:MAG: hypothetical protein Q8R16_04215, partial [bacterium]|nr:hypothetical protein [bacterium]
MSLRPFDPIDIAPESVPTDAAPSEYMGRAASPWRIGVAFILLTVGGLALLARSFQLQVIRADALTIAAARNRSRTEIIVPTRGIITDRHGTPLVRNVPRYTIGIIPADVATGSIAAATVEQLAQTIGVAPELINDALRHYPRSLAEPVAIRENLSYEDAAKILVDAGTQT